MGVCFFVRWKDFAPAYFASGSATGDRQAAYRSGRPILSPQPIRALPTVGLGARESTAGEVEPTRETPTKNSWKALGGNLLL